MHRIIKINTRYNCINFIKNSLETSIEPITACSASILFGNSLKLSFTILKIVFHENCLYQNFNLNKY